MHKFEGMGTTHFTVGQDEGNKESLKLRVHHFTMKMVDGHVCAFWKQHMRDKELQPPRGRGWRVFMPGADLDLKHLTTMPTYPPADMKSTEATIRVCSISDPWHDRG